MAQQLSFELPVRTTLAREDFYVAPSNAIAVLMIDRWPDWPIPQLALTGPAGSGKTHLAHVWAARSGAPLIAARDLATADIVRLASGPVVVEDIPRIARDPACLQALFHLFNLTKSAHVPLILTGRGAPTHWHLDLPDIQSRAAAAHHVELTAPDDTLLAAVLGKLFADRQITPRPDVIPYLVRHMERSFEQAARIVTDLDRRALDQGRTLSRALAAQVIGLESGAG